MAARTRSAARRAPVAPPPAAAPRTWVVALLLFAGLFTLYVANARMLAAGDSIPTRRLPFSLVRELDLDLDEFTWELDAQGRAPYYVHRAHGHVYSVSTVASAVVVAPLYVLPAWWLARNDVGYDDVRARVLEVVMERISAALLAALGAALLFVVLRRLTTWRWALGLTLIYALGTSTWAIASQALWPHALAQVTLVAVSLVLLAPAPSRAALVGAGLMVALMVANRPQMLIVALLATGFVARHRRRDLVAFAALPALMAIALALYNRVIFTTVTGGYGGFGSLRGTPLEGLAGLLVSPSRGLLIYTPIMAFALWGAVRLWRTAAPPWLRWLSVGVGLHVLLHASFVTWWAGHTYGPRYFTDVLPALTIFLLYGLVPFWRRPALRALAALLVAWGVGVQAIGVYAADDAWHREPLPISQAPHRLWDWSDTQIARSLGNGFRGGELAVMLCDAFRDPVPAALAVLTPADLAARIEVPELPAPMRRAQTAPVTVGIENAGGRAWPAFNGEGVISARYLVFLMVRWFDGERLVPATGDVLPLPQNVAPGERVRLEVPLQAPARPGRYTVELRVTQAVDGTRGIVGPDAWRRAVRVE